MTDLLDDLRWRGLIHQSTDETALRQALHDGPLTLYVGFDPTADSLHAGNLVPLITLRRFQEAGHRPIVLAGGATGLIGDPSGRTAERTLNTPETVRQMAELIRQQLARFVVFEGENAALLVNNLDWTENIDVLTFLRDVGKHFSVSHMIAREAVAARLSTTGISYTEFSYQLLQANDFLELYRRYGCRAQLGGSDQWGNITAGLDLVRRATGHDLGDAHGVTTPLLTTATGEKFGKSTGGGALWLDAAKTSPYAWYQYWVNADDRDVIDWLKVFTFLSREEIENLEVEMREKPQLRSAQKALARELTTQVHGSAETQAVIDASKALFGRASLEELPIVTLGAALSEAGLIEVHGQMPSLPEVLVESELSPSLSAARRTIKEGGVYLNNEKVEDAELALQECTWLHGRYLVLRRGRRHVAGVHRAPSR